MDEVKKTEGNHQGEEEERKCPLRIPSALNRCIKERCAWFSRVDAMCAIHCIVGDLSTIANHFSVLSARDPTDDKDKVYFPGRLRQIAQEIGDLAEDIEVGQELAEFENEGD